MTDLPFSCFDPETPGRVYLCQVRPGVSCGACCGLYNVSDASRSAIFEMLKKRTDLFASVNRSYEGVLAFADEIEKTENQSRPIDDFHHCPYIGFMDTDPVSPGCLLHPRAEGNNGLDLRGVSYYGGMPCHMYFCPTCHEIPDRYKKAIRYAAVDWHSFGLIITESEAIKNFFENVENDAAKLIDPEEISKNQKLREALKSFIEIKTEWPFRKDKILANYFFKDGDKGLPSENEYASKTRWTPVLKAFRSEISKQDDLAGAVDLLEKTALNMVRAML